MALTRMAARGVFRRRDGRNDSQREKGVIMANPRGTSVRAGYRLAVQAVRAITWPIKRLLPWRVRAGLRAWMSRPAAPPALVRLPPATKPGQRRTVLDGEPLRHPRAGIGTFTFELARALP